MKSGERLIEALEAYEQEKISNETYQSLLQSNPETAPPPRHPLVIASGLSEKASEFYILHIVKSIKNSHLNESLLVLPFGHIKLLLECISVWIEKVVQLL